MSSIRPLLVSALPCGRKSVSLVAAAASNLRPAACAAPLLHSVSATRCHNPRQAQCGSTRQKVTAVEHVELRRRFIVDPKRKEAEDQKRREKVLSSLGDFARGVPTDLAVSILKATDLYPNPQLRLHVHVHEDKHIQHLRAKFKLPRPLALDMRLLVFAEGQQAEEAKKAGAQIVGGPDLFTEIITGSLRFDRVLCTPDLAQKMPHTVKRILGPAGLMPTERRGTVTNDMKRAVKENQGLVEAMADEFHAFHIDIAKHDFSTEEIDKNIRAVMDAVYPIGEAFTRTPEKPTYVRYVELSSTNGMSFRLGDYEEPTREEEGV